MNRKALLIVSLVVLVSTGAMLLQSRANQAVPEPTTLPRTITAEGSASVTGKPDSARVYFTVVTNKKTVAEAREENTRVVGRVQAALLALKLPDLKSKTLASSVSINYEDRDKSRIVGYDVQQSFTALVKEPDSEKLGTIAARILDAGLQNGVNSGGEVEFFKADDSEMKRQAMAKAVEDGIANAQAYAAGAKLRTVGVVEISGQDNSFSWNRNGFNGGFGVQGGLGGGGGAARTFVTGDWKVSSHVRVVMGY